jgi:hypothetical protein
MNWGDARDWYGYGLACPMEFDLQSQFLLPKISPYPPRIWTCTDRGGRVKTQWINGKPVVTLDLLSRVPLITGNYPVKVTVPMTHSLVGFCQMTGCDKSNGRIRE